VIGIVAVTLRFLNSSTGAAQNRSLFQDVQKKAHEEEVSGGQGIPPVNFYRPIVTVVILAVLSGHV
jgi:hypothetical protein